MTISASIPAAVVSMGVLRLFRRSNILENNIVQTAASAGESLAAGVIFTFPALVIMNYWEKFDYIWVTVIAGFGGILGTLFTIPLRRALIVEDKLTFPEGIATADVLKSGDRGSSDIKYIIRASAVGGIFKLCESGLRLWNGTAVMAHRVGCTMAYFGSNLSPALISVGYIVGFNIAVLLFLGGAFNWLIAIPIYASLNDWPIIQGKPLSALDWAGTIWSTQTRYIGVGAMLVGGLWTIVKIKSSLFRGIKSGLEVYQHLEGKTTTIDRKEKDIPMRWVLISIAVSLVPLFLVYQVFVANISISVPMAVIMLLAGFVFSAVAAYMAGVVGSSNNPISGVTIAMVLVSALLLLFLMGAEAKTGPAAAIIMGSVVCCAAAIAGDVMQDLKTGYIVGATPWKQQLMEIVGTVAAALVMAPILTLLLKAYGFAGHESAKQYPLIAAQANLIASVAKGVFAGQLPWYFIFLGMGMAVLVILLDEYLARRGSSFRTPVLAVAIGVYLPFELSVPIFAGGIIHRLVKKCHSANGMTDNDIETTSGHGMLIASGLITGEALLGILLAIPIVLSGKPDVLAVTNNPLGAWPGVILLTGICCWLFHVARGKRKDSMR